MASALEDAVTAWLADDAWETRLSMRSSSHLLLLFRRREASTGWIELGHKREGPEDRAALSRLGLARKRWFEGAKAWGRHVDIHPADATAPRTLAQTLTNLWQAACDFEPYEVEVLAQRDEPPSNQRLVAAMRAAASARDAASRQRLYAALVSAHMLVPIDPESAQRAPEEQQPLSLGSDAQGITTWAAFSGWDALRQWRPQGHPFGLVHGSDFFAHVHDVGRSTVRINPEGVVGGELYPAEIKMMVETVRRFFGQT